MATAPPVSARERRRHRRYTLNVPARVQVAPATAPVNGTLYDMSEGGAFFVAEVAVEIGAAAFATFKLGDQTAEAVGSVLRTSPFGDALGIGVDFRVGNDVFVDFMAELQKAPEGGRPVLLAGIRDLLVRLGG